MRRALLFLFLAWSNLCVTAQTDSSVILHIIDANVCLNKKTSALNFSYYFENKSSRHQVVADYYEPCYWENLRHVPDTSQSLGLYLVIKDDSGKVVLPEITMDTTAMQHHEQYAEDSTKFYSAYERTKDKEFIFHTRSLRPQDVLINLYNLKLNRRKCFYKSTFKFDYSRKYTFMLCYQAKEDIVNRLNHSALSSEDEIFIGEIHSNEVELCFK